MEKRCPTCNRKYVDDDINYCLADGSFLLTRDELNPTEPTPAIRITDAPTDVLPARQADIPTEVMNAGGATTAPGHRRPTAPSKGIGPVPLIIASLAFLAVVIAGVVFLVANGRSDSDTSATANLTKGNSPSTSTKRGALSNYATPVPSPMATPAASPTATPATDPSLRKITGMLDLSGTYKYDRLIGIDSDRPFNAGDYTSRKEGNELYVMIRNSTMQGSLSLPGGGAIDGAEMQQRGSDVVLVVKAKEGTKNWVWRNNAVLLVQVGLRK